MKNAFLSQFPTYFLRIFFILLTTLSSNSLAKEKSNIDGFRDLCKKDLDFFKIQLEQNSAPFANKSDKHFHEWYNKGYKNALELIKNISDDNDCHYVMKYYANGFDQSHISIRGYIPLPQEQYPGILSVKKGNNHYIIYKNPTIKYLKHISVGDKITHINGIETENFYQDYVKPFYANDNSTLTLSAASIYNLIIDGNVFKPVPTTITIEKEIKKETKNEKQLLALDLKYTMLEGGALAAAKKIRQPEPNEAFKVEVVSDGVWIKIPTFFPTRQEAVYFTGMLSRLKNDLAKEDYILFDLRGNRGGAIKWSVPIIRNLWGDEYIKSLKSGHDYNKTWIKKLRISKDNFAEFKKTYDEAASKSYMASLQKGENFFLKKWSIFNDKDNLYTNNDNTPFKAKIYVLTDTFCRSTCWNFVKELKQIPGVVHLGQETTIQNIYSYAKTARSPSTHFDFFYPTQIRVQPENNLSFSLVPDIIYNGDLKNEPAVIDWVLSITEKAS